MFLSFWAQQVPAPEAPPKPGPVHGPQTGPATCPDENDEDIIVCAPQEDQRFRIERPFRRQPTINDRGDLSVIQERMRWIEGDPMDMMGYCTSVGPNGWQGCMFEDWKRQRQEKGLAY